jgi:DNA-binding PucR family transcriptional regulator
LAALGLGPAGVGVAGPAEGAPAVARARREAAEVLRTLLTLGRTDEVADAAGLGLARLVLGHNGPAELGDFVAGAIGPVLEYDEVRGTALVATLEAWFAAGGSPTVAAEALHVHPNTVAQRLDRVAELLGTGWRDGDRALEVQLALRMWRLTTSVSKPH